MIVSKPISKNRYDVCIVHLADARFYPFFHRQVSALAEKGYRVALVSWESTKGEGDPKWSGIDVYPITIPSKSVSGKRFFVRYFFSCILVLLRVRAQLYEAVDPPALLPARIAARFHRGRYNYFSLEYFQGVDTLVARPVIRWFWFLLEWLGVGAARNVAAVCSTTEGFLRQEYRLKRTSVVLNVPNKSEYTAAPDGRLRRRLGIAADTPLVIYKGEIAENRGLLPFIAAMEQFESLHFALVGSGTYREPLKSAAAGRGLAARVHFCDPVKSDEFVYYLKDASAGQVIHETRGANMMVTLPSKLFDYINAGIPVIASDGPEISRIVREWKLGWVVSPSSRASIENAIADFLKTFPDLEAFKKNCAAAAERFCWENEKKVYIDFMEEAMGK